MDDLQRQMMNLRTIQTTFRVAVESHPQFSDAACRRALMLLGQLRQGTTSAKVLDAVAAVEAEVEGRAVTARTGADANFG